VINVFSAVEQRAFDPRDAYKIKLLDSDKGRDVYSITQHMEDMWGVSYYYDNQLLAIACAMEINCNTVEMWMFLDQSVGDYLRWLHQETSRLLRAVNHQYPRIQCIVLCSWDSSIKFIERYGFKREGKMECFGCEGEDYYIYARVRKEG
jgi:hypothetical protein